MVTARPLRPCTTPGCPARVTGGRCQVHAGLARRHRETWSSLYGPQWPARRLDYLSRHPRCELCPRMARVADHYPRGIKLLRLHNTPDPHLDRYLRPLCWSCHSRATAQREPGGWNAR